MVIFGVVVNERKFREIEIYICIFLHFTSIFFQISLERLVSMILKVVGPKQIKLGLPMRKFLAKKKPQG